MDAPEANAAVLCSVQDADLGTAFLVGSRCLLKKMVLILLTNCEDNTVTVIGGLCVFSPAPFFCYGCFPPKLFFK